MKPRTNRHMQLNLGLAAPAPTTIPDEKDEELALALVDLLMEAISMVAAPENEPEESR